MLPQRSFAAPIVVAVLLTICPLAQSFSEAGNTSYIYLDDSFSLDLPKGWVLQEAPGIVLRDNGNILVLNRGEHQLLEFDSDGRFIREIGAGLFVSPHGLRLDGAGNIWATDSETHLVIRFSPAGEVSMVLGKKNTPGRGRFDRDYYWTLFDKPSDVGFDSSGNIYVVDTGNERVVKFSPDGDFVSEWGHKGDAPGEFDFPHAIVVDKSDNLYVADRENKRIQIFSSSGDFIAERKDIGYPYGMTLGREGDLWVADARVEKLSHFDSTGDLLGYYQARGKDAGEFESVHGIAVDESNRLYTTEILNWRVQRFLFSD